MKKKTQMLIVLCTLILIGCSASMVINKGDNNKINTTIDTEPDTNVKIDSVSILDKNKNKNI